MAAARSWPPTVEGMASGGTVIGFVGIGTMGAPIAAHLVAAGHDVRVFDRSTRADGVGAPGRRRWPSIVRGGGRCRRACSSRCPARPTSRPPSLGAGGVLAAEPRAGPRRRPVDELARRRAPPARARAPRPASAFVDAPVSGGRVKAESGELSVMVGGDDADVAAVEPLLQPFAGAGLPRRPGRAPAPSPSSSTTSCSSPPRCSSRRPTCSAPPPASSRPTLHRDPPGQLRRPVRRAGPAAARPRLRRRDLPPRHRRQGPRRSPSTRRGATASTSRSARRRSRSTATPSTTGLGGRGVPRHAAAGRGGGRHRAAAAHADRRGRRDVATGARRRRPVRRRDVPRRLPARALPLAARRTTRCPGTSRPQRTPDGEGFWVVSRHADVEHRAARPGDVLVRPRRHPRAAAARRSRTSAPPGRCSTRPTTRSTSGCGRSSTAASRRGRSPPSTDELRRRGAALLDAAGERAVRLRPRLRPRAAVAGDLPRARRARGGPAGAARLARRRHRGRLAVDPVAGRDAPASATTPST